MWRRTVAMTHCKTAAPRGRARYEGRNTTRPVGCPDPRRSLPPHRAATQCAVRHPRGWQASEFSLPDGRMRLSLGFSPCPNDTFIFDALVHGRVEAGALRFDPVLEDVQTL